MIIMIDMNKMFLLAFVMCVSSMVAQVSPTYEKADDLVKATYFYEDGKIKEQGFFKGKKLEGTWVTFDKKGNKTAIAHYESGRKVGKWFLWENETLKEIDYKDNKIANVQTWKGETALAIK